MEYKNESGAMVPLRVHTILISTQHAPGARGELHKWSVRGGQAVEAGPLCACMQLMVQVQTCLALSSHLTCLEQQVPSSPLQGRLQSMTAPARCLLAVRPATLTGASQCWPCWCSGTPPPPPAL